MNGCFRSIQSNDLKSANYWLTQLEHEVLQAKQQLQQSKEREAQISDLVHFLCQYSTTARSDSLFVQEARYFPGTSVEQQSRRKIYDNWN